VPFDYIGLSYYPFWNGPLRGLKENLTFLANTYHKDIIIAETDSNWRGGDPKRAYFPATPAGQKASFEELIRTVEATPGGHGQGLFYWGGEWIDNGSWQGPGWLNAWEDRALFDSAGNALPVMDAFKAPPSP
jgi:arabinogalactan endo-1,4-beta-galactosidase